MTERMMKLVHGIRIGIYLALFCAIAVAGVIKFVHAQEPQTFWPPDMVPHPHPPPSEPKDDDLA